MLQYLPALEAAGFSVHTHAMFDDATLTARYAKGGYGTRTLMACFAHRFAQLWCSKQFDLVWIEKEALPWWPLWLERLLLSGVPYVLDFDDAVFHHYDQHRLSIVRSIFGKRIDGLMAGAALVICGNDYLAQRARQAGSPRVEILPTVIDLERYQLTKPMSRDIPRIVWIGSPTTVKYLDMMRDPLIELARTTPFVFQVIGGQTEVQGVKTECLPWTESTEVRDLFNSDIGVMPLADTTWERGKCGYKLIQYMACGLPVVASPVGANSTIVHPAENGFLAADEQEWISSLGQLLADSKLRQQLGRHGRLLVEQQYCLQVTAPKLIVMLREVAETARLRHGKR
jgi:glycosyltransferase involved in cell wall biosynthesis